jgi:DNA repair exonuclease SbcCD nuclease subunit
MSKICIVGDMHWRFELPYASTIPDGRKSEWENVLDKIVEAANTCDAVVFLGDLFNSRHNHSSVIREVVTFLNRFGNKEVHIIVGNHCRYGTSTALDFLQKMKHKNWVVYSSLTRTKVAGQEALMIPYMTPALLGVETKEEALQLLATSFSGEFIPLAFAHHGFAGGKIHGFPIEMLNEIVLPEAEMSRHFGQIFAGHIHEKQVIFPNIYMTGNVFTSEVGEHEKSIWIYGDDGTTKTIEQIRLPVRGIYKVIAGDNQLAAIPDASIVKVFVTDPMVNLETIKEEVKRFDASIIIEQYPSDRTKVHFEEGGLDLSVENMLEQYSKAKNLSYTDIMEGFELIK